MRRWIQVAARGVGAALAALAATATCADTPKSGGTLTYAVTAEPPNYDCHAIDTYAGLHVLAPHYSNLIKVDAETFPAIKGDLAQSWTISPDGLTYTFKLKSGIVFHDGSPLDSRDIKATFDRLRAPTGAVISMRQGQFEDIASIDTPDAATVVMKLKAPNASMLSTLAMPWNCVYSAAKLAQDPNWPAKNIMGTGAFVFVEHVAGSHWIGKKHEKYFAPGRPYLDGFKALFVKPLAVANALRAGQIDAEFRSVTPAERDTLVSSMKDKIAIQESSWLCKMEFFFNDTKKPFDDPRVRRALTLAIDRWGASGALSKISIVKAIGGPLRPGSELALSQEDISKLPGFGRNIENARTEAKRLLAEAGVPNLSFKMINRITAHPYTPTGVYVIDQWRRIGVTAEHVQLDVAQQKAMLFGGQFDVGMDASCDDADDPLFQFTRYLSHDKSPRSFRLGSNRALDTIYDQIKASSDPAERKKLSNQFESEVLTEAYDVPVIWYQRIVALSSAVRGWKISPSHYVGQDLVDVWLDR
jgi:peptide/nickel transport system substrate-binding protein